MTLDLENKVARAAVGSGRKGARHVKHPQPKVVKERLHVEAPGIGQQPTERLVDATAPTGYGLHQVGLKDVLPERPIAVRVGRDQLDDSGLVHRPLAYPVLFEAITHVAVGQARFVHMDGMVEAAHALPLKRRIGQVAVPPVGGSVCGSGLQEAQAFVDRGQLGRGCAGIKEIDAT